MFFLALVIFQCYVFATSGVRDREEKNVKVSTSVKYSIISPKTKYLIEKVEDVDENLREVFDVIFTYKLNNDSFVESVSWWFVSVIDWNGLPFKFCLFADALIALMLKYVVGNRSKRAGNA